MKRTIIGTFALAAALLAIPSPGQAAPVSCPETLPNADGDTRQYTLTPNAGTATCVYGYDNINGQAGDDFLEDNPTYGAITGANLNLFNVYGDGGISDPVGNDDNSGTYTIDPSAWTLYSAIVFAIKDGGDPLWAAFFLPTGNTGGAWDIDGIANSCYTNPSTENCAINENAGSWSHHQWYGIPLTGDGEEDDQEPLPEPASLMLLGAGLAAAGLRARRRRAQ